MSPTDRSGNSPSESAIARQIDSWRKIGFSTARAEREQACDAIKQQYARVRLRPPRYFVWLDSPWKGAVAAAILSRLTPTCYDPVLRIFKETFAKKIWTYLDGKSSDLFWKETEQRISKAVLSSYGSIHTQIQQCLLSQLTGSTRPTTTAGITNEQMGTQVMLDRLIDDMKGQIPDIYFTGMRPFTDNGLTSQLASSAVSQTWYCGVGSHDPDLAFFDFCRYSGVNVSELDSLITLARTCGWWWPLQDVCIISERPRFISVDREGRLHSNKSVSLQYPDNWSIYAWHGAFVPARFIRWAQTRSIDGVMTEPNIELRRMMVEIVGLETFMLKSGARRFQEDECGTMYVQELEDDEPIVTVCVTNSTPEPDGHFKKYFLRVPPHIRTAREAVAWTFGMASHEYRPLRET